MPYKNARAKIQKEADKKAEHFEKYLFKVFYKLVEAYNLDDDFHLDFYSIRRISCSIVEDLERLKFYHNINEPNTYKIAAYAFKWIAHFRPIQYNIDKRKINKQKNINELFSTEIACSLLKLSLDCITKEEQEKFIYQAQYRNIDPKELSHTFYWLDKYCKEKIKGKI